MTKLNFMVREKLGWIVNEKPGLVVKTIPTGITGLRMLNRYLVNRH